MGLLPLAKFKIKRKREQVMAMSVEVIQSLGMDAPFRQAVAEKPVKAEGPKQVLGAMSPGHNVLVEGKSETVQKLLQLEGIHARHTSVPDSLLKGTMNNAGENGWSPAHDRLGGLNKMPQADSSAKHASKPQNGAPQKKQTGANAGSRPPQAVASSGIVQQQNGSQTARAADEESVDYDSSLENTSVSSFDFNRERSGHRSVVGALHKPAPSKWDDAEKWLVSVSSDAVGTRTRPKMQLMSAIPSHVIINASKKAALLGQQARLGGMQGKSGSALLMGADVLTENGVEVQDHMCTKKIDTTGPYKFSFMPSPGQLPSKARSMSSLDRYPLEELLGCDEGKLKVVSLSDEAVDVDMCKPALRTEKPTSDFPTIDSQSNLSNNSEPPRSPASYVTPPGLRSVSMRDMGTEMTPIASQEPSRTGTPLRATTPTIRSPVSSRPSTPGRAARPPSSKGNCGEDDNAEESGANTSCHPPETPELQLSKTRQEILALGTQLGKANIAAWASREEEEEDASKCLKNIDLEEVKKNVVEARAAAWEEAEKSKYEARYKREEAKIIAWENHEKAKAEAEMRRIEVKVERMRSHSQEQLMNKLAAARRRAEELRAAADARRVETAAKTAQRAEYIRQTGNMPPPSSSSPFSLVSQIGRLCC